MKKSNLIKIGLVLISTIIVFSGCSGGSSEVGFKGMNIGADADNVCSIVKQYADDNKGKYFKDKKRCRADLKLNGVFYQEGWLTAYFNENQKITKINIGSYWSDIIFNSKGLSNKAFAQALIDNKDWLNELKVLVNPVQAYYPNAAENYGYTDTENAWKINVIGKGVILKSIQKASF